MSGSSPTKNFVIIKVAAYKCPATISVASAPTPTETAKAEKPAAILAATAAATAAAGGKNIVAATASIKSGTPMMIPNHGITPAPDVGLLALGRMLRPDPAWPVGSCKAIGFPRQYT